MNTSNSHTDAELIEAGQAFEAAIREFRRIAPIYEASGVPGQREDRFGYGALEDRRSELSHKIVETPAHTIEGFAAKARNLAEANLDDEDWATPLDELDWDKYLLVDLINGLCTAAGVDRFGRPLSVNQAA